MNLFDGLIGEQIEEDAPDVNLAARQQQFLARWMRRDDYGLANATRELAELIALARREGPGPSEGDPTP